MLEGAYYYDVLGFEGDVFKYRFESVGNNEIIKIVSISPTVFGESIFNLSFGNLEKLKDGSVFVNDNSKVNNTDYNEVLATVFACLLHYLVEINNTAVMLFFGNTEHKNDLYKRKVSSNLEQLIPMLNVSGGSLIGDVPLISREEVVNSNRGKRIREVREKDMDVISEMANNLSVKFIESFKKERIKDYQFVLIEAK